MQPRGAVLVACACAIQIATYGCFFNLTPLYPLVGRDLGMDAGSLGALVGVGGIVALLAQLPAGSGGDAFGRRPFFAAGMVCLVISLLLRWQAEQPAMLLIGQMAAGLAQGMCSLNAFALAAEARAARALGRSIGLVNASANVGQVFGYLMAGTVGAAIGWHDLSLVMIVVPIAVLGLVLLVPDLRFSQRATGQPGPVGVLRALLHPRRLAFSAIGVFTLATGSGAAYLLPFIVQAQAFGPLLAAVLLVPYIVGSVVAAPLSADLASRWGAGRLVIAALLGGIATCAALAWAGGFIPVLVVANVLVGMCVNTVLPVAATLVVNLQVGRGRIGPGAAMAGLRVGMSLGPFVGPTVAGSALARGGPQWAWLALGACLLLSLGLFRFGAAQQRQSGAAT